MSNVDTHFVPAGSPPSYDVSPTTLFEGYKVRKTEYGYELVGKRGGIKRLVRSTRNPSVLQVESKGGWWDKIKGCEWVHENPHGQLSLMSWPPAFH